MNARQVSGRTERWVAGGCWIHAVPGMARSGDFEMTAQIIADPDKAAEPGG